MRFIIIFLFFLPIACGVTTAKNMLMYNYDLSYALARTLSLSHATKFSKNYNEKLFNQIRLGMTKTEVFALVGEPLRTSSDGRILQYTRAAIVNADFDMRTIELNYDNIVLSINHIYFID